jgi:ABC-type Mn2+/Zn2+ transport system ATPase subunit
MTFLKSCEDLKPSQSLQTNGSNIMSNPLIEFKNVNLGYGKRKIINNLNFVIKDGDFLGLVGPNGAGKTTLLKAILGILRPVSGEIVFHKEDEHVKFGYVPQRDSINDIFLFTVKEVIAMGRYGELGLFGRMKNDDWEIVRNSMEHVGISELENVLYKSLSGGQRQRTLIARALASEPTILALDEPTNNMDSTSRKAMLDLIQALHDVDQLTVIMVSHLLLDVADYAKKIMIIENESVHIESTE